mgnify:CR=1 FL=1
MHVSALPLLLDCPSSQEPTEHPYDPGSDAADMGSGTHDGLAEHVMGRDQDLATLAKSYGVHLGELRKLVGYGKLAWDEIKDDFPNVQVEVPLQSVCGLRGRADIFGMSDDLMAFGDWKTSRERSDVRAQLKGYALAAADMYGLPPSGQVQAFTIWLRLGEIDCETFSADELARFRDQVGWAKRSIGKRYAPGEACTYCRRQLVCEAKREYLQAAVGALQPLGVGMRLDPASLPGLYVRARVLGRALDQFRSALRVHLRDAGPQPDGHGGILELQTRCREEIDPLKAWPLLTGEGFTDDDLATCVTLSSGAISDVAAAKAPKGMKGKARQAIRQLLRDKGATTRKEYQQIQLIKGTTNE